MHIKQIVVEGFKCYKDRIAADPFSPKHNVVGAPTRGPTSTAHARFPPPSVPPGCVGPRAAAVAADRRACVRAVGANGAGKSNFFAAVNFVLSEGAPLRAEERKQLLHEGAGTHVMSAYVEIYFDNSDNRFPIEKDEVVLKRAIGLKKDECARPPRARPAPPPGASRGRAARRYFLDRKHVTKNEVTNLLESAGFSRSNPYNVVPQGKVTMLTTMKDEQRLDLLKEVAGTRIYSDRRKESLGIMHETASRREKITEMLGYIEKRLHELDAEREELATYQALDKRRKVMEYTYYDKEQRKARSELDKMDARRAEEAERAGQQQSREEEAKGRVKEAERQLISLQSDLKMLLAECTSLNAEHKTLIEDAARMEMTVAQDAADGDSASAKRREVDEELAALSQQVGAVEAQLAKLAPDCSSKVRDAAPPPHTTPPPPRAFLPTDALTVTGGSRGTPLR